MLPTFSYVRPTSLAQAIRELSSPGARAHAGGTDVVGCLRDGVYSADKLVSLSGLAELRGVSRTASGGLRIGALTTLAELAANPLVREKYRVLADAAAAAASPQLRNQGTLGGNLCQRPRCWYFRGDFECLRKGGGTCFAAEGENQLHAIFGGESCFMVHPSDTAPALTALDAAVSLVGPGGARSVPIDAFFVPPERDFMRETVVEPGEIVSEIVVPPPLQGARGCYSKLRARGAWDFALVGAAVVVATRGASVSHARIVLSGVAAIPWRVAKAEELLVGHALDDATIERAVAKAAEGATPMSGNEYKVALVRGAVAEALGALG
ncbi:MAG: xanthine dehydrogenase family protein subunit M [Thermoanaerobaculia bacterium]|nr:xanthine dehydrogenase family protein subunit M [Thermoanaerobaculia bacterium]